MLPQELQKQLEEMKEIEQEFIKETTALSQEKEQTIVETAQQESVSTEEKTTTPEVNIDWENKYKELEKELDYLKTKLNLFEYTFANPPQSQAPVQQQTTTEDPEIETLKNEFPDIYNAIDKLLKKYVPKEELERQEAVTRHKLFYTQLAQIVPDWESLNTNQEFINWLGHKERFANATRHELMLSAFNNGDVNTVAEFFKAFKEEKQARSQNIAPPIGRTQSIASNLGTKPIITRREIEHFYRDVALGRIPQDQKLKREKEFFEAMQENRIV